MKLTPKECEMGLRTSIGVLFFAAFVWLLSGCTPAAKTNMSAVINSAADVIDARVLVWRDHVRVEAKKQARFCNEDDDGCKITAIRKAFEKYEGERVLIEAAASTQHALREAFETFRTCERVKDTVCAAEAMGSLVRIAPELEHMIQDLQTQRVK